MDNIKDLLKSLGKSIVVTFGIIYAIISAIFDSVIKYFKNFDFSSDYAHTKDDLVKYKNKIVNYFKNFNLKNHSKKQLAIAGAIIICFMLIISNDFTALSQNLVARPCKIISVDGKEVVKIPTTLNIDIVNELNNYLTTQEGKSAKVTSKFTIEAGKGYGYEVDDATKVVEELAKVVDYSVMATDLKLDEEHLAYVNSIADISVILDEIKAPYQDPKYTLVDFKEEITFDDTYAPKDEVLTNEQAEELLKGNRQDKKVHTVVEGDTLWDLSVKNEVTVDDIIYCNPGMTENSLLQLDQEIVISNSIPTVSVRTYERVTYDTVAPYDTKTVKNDKEFVTHKKVVTTGVNGTKKVMADVVRDNGVETDRLIIEEKVTKEPVTEVIEIGTMNTPPKKAVGSFVYPTSGRISDRFGARGGRHEGIDIANAAGTPIKASDGGVVEYSGWQSGFGNLVIVNHQNGYKTYYGHNSKIVVSVGQKVAQGEVIAKMGSTGRSTGNHCHFEVHVNGVPQNPFNYLSQ